jgi:tRNA modification GTPase
VSNVPGTTRDVVDGLVGVDGVVLRIRDTAGIRSASDEIEEEALRRTRCAVEDADIALVIFDISRPLSAEDLDVIEEVSPKTHLIVANKVDLGQQADLSDIEPAIRISALNGWGISDLTDRLTGIAHSRIGDVGCQIIVSERHASCLAETLVCISRAASALGEDLPPEFIASDIRLALDSLGEITGRNVSSGVLDEIFSRFCIGK